MRKEVERVFAEVGEKPVIEQAQRIGLPGNQPVRVKLRNRIAALSVVREDFSGVFISPDKSPEERERQRELVKEVQRRRAHMGDDFHRRHYIMNGEVVTVERPWADQEKDGLDKPK